MAMSMVQRLEVILVRGAITMISIMTPTMTRTMPKALRAITMTHFLGITTPMAQAPTEHMDTIVVDTVITALLTAITLP